MIHKIIASFITILLVMATATASDEITETPFKDWTVRCAGTQTTRCEMYQTVFADAKQTQRALLAVVGYPNGSTDPGMIIVLPLGISFPPGTFVQVDDGGPIRVPVERCEKDGCRIELLLAAGFLETLMSGNQATVIAHDRQRRSFSIPFSLQGFTAAFNALK